MAGFLDFLGPVTAVVNGVLALIPNANDRAKAQEDFARAIQDAAAKADEGQRTINLAEAQSSSLFVSGWRPGIGWVGVLALASYYIPQHLMAAFLWTKLAWAAQTLPPYPISMDDTLMQLVVGLLGLGAMRTVEKVMGTKPTGEAGK